jgi:hypothetical protein
MLAPAKNLAARGLGSVETPKMPQARQTPSGTGAAALGRVERMTRRFLPWKAPALGPALLEAVERRRDIGSKRESVKRSHPQTRRDSVFSAKR